MRRNSGAIGEPAKDSAHNSAANGPEAEIARLTRERDEALEQQAATSEVLNVINRSRFDLQQILQSVVDTATRLCHGESAVIFRLDDGVYRFAAGYCVDPEYLEMERATTIVAWSGHVDRTCCDESASC